MADTLGLPEGVRFVRFGTCGPDEYNIIGGRIYPGPRPGAITDIVVTPVAGYTFIYNIDHDGYDVVKAFDPPKEYRLVLTASNSQEDERLVSFIERFKRAKVLKELNGEPQVQEAEDDQRSASQADGSPNNGSDDAGVGSPRLG